MLENYLRAAGTGTGRINNTLGSLSIVLKIMEMMHHTVVRQAGQLFLPVLSHVSTQL